MPCAICGKTKRNDLCTIRQSWLDAGGFGYVPPAARVHPECDAQEQHDLKAGKLKLSDLWRKVEVNRDNDQGA